MAYCGPASKTVLLQNGVIKELKKENDELKKENEYRTNHWLKQVLEQDERLDELTKENGELKKENGKLKNVVADYREWCGKSGSQETDDDFSSETDDEIDETDDYTTDELIKSLDKLEQDDPSENCYEI